MVVQVPDQSGANTGVLTLGTLDGVIREIREYLWELQFSAATVTAILAPLTMPRSTVNRRLIEEATLAVRALYVIRCRGRRH